MHLIFLSPIIAASVVLIHRSRILLLKRATEPLEGFYTLPGGKVKMGERIVDAAMRELCEETGIVAEPTRLLAPVEFIRRNGEGAVEHHFVICPCMARWRQGEGISDPAIGALLWASLDEALLLPLTPGLADILVRAFETAG